MRQYDICRNPNKASRTRVPFLVILQSDLMRDFQTVVVAPLVHETIATKISRLNPSLMVQGKNYHVSMVELAGVSRKQLGEVVTNVRDQHLEFVAAIDLVFTGI